MGKEEDDAAAAVASELKKLRSKRAGIKGWLTRDISAIHNLIAVSTHTKGELSSLLESLKSRLVTFRNIQSNIEEYLSDDDISKEITAQAPHDKKCVDAISSCLTAIDILDTKSSVSSSANSSTKTPSSSTNSTNSLYQIPKISLVPFSGDLLKWLPFIQGWTNSIGAIPDDSLPKRVKISLLQQYVKSPAADTISFYSQIDENYDEALSALISKYGDEERLIDAHIDELLTLKDRASSWSLNKLYDHLVYIIHALETLKVARDQYGVILVPMLKNLFPSEIKRQWAKFDYENKRAYKLLVKQSQQNTPPTQPPPPENRLTIIMNFLKEQVEIDSLIIDCTNKSESDSHISDKKEATGRKPTTTPQFDLKKPGFTGTGTAVFNQNNATTGSHSTEPSQTHTQPFRSSNLKADRVSVLPPCPFCKLDHHPDCCSIKFQFSPQQATEYLEQAGRCTRCMGLHHKSVCKYQRSCALCGQDHNTLVCSFRQKVNSTTNVEHPNQQFEQSNQQFVKNSAYSPCPVNMNSANITSTSMNSASSNHTSQFTVGLSDENSSPVTVGRVLHQTATVIASTRERTTLVRCLFDGGAGRTYITKSICEYIQPKIIRRDLVASHGFGGHSTSPSFLPVVELTLKSRHSDASITCEALVTESIANCSFDFLPEDSLNMPYLSNLQLADNPSFSHMEISILIGLDLYWKIVGNEHHRGPSHCPVAVSSMFGWLLSGPGGPEKELEISNQTPSQTVFPIESNAK